MYKQQGAVWTEEDRLKQQKENTEFEQKQKKERDIESIIDNEIYLNVLEYAMTIKTDPQMIPKIWEKAGKLISENSNLKLYNLVGTELVKYQSYIKNKLFEDKKFDRSISQSERDAMMGVRNVSVVPSKPTIKKPPYTKNEIYDLALPYAINQFNIQNFTPYDSVITYLSNFSENANTYRATVFQAIRDARVQANQSKGGRRKRRKSRKHKRSRKCRKSKKHKRSSKKR